MARRVRARFRLSAAVLAAFALCALATQPALAGDGSLTYQWETEDFINCDQAVAPFNDTWTGSVAWTAPDRVGLDDDIEITITGTMRRTAKGACPGPAKSDTVPIIAPNLLLFAEDIAADKCDVIFGSGGTAFLTAHGPSLRALVLEHPAESGVATRYLGGPNGFDESLALVFRFPFPLEVGRYTVVPYGVSHTVLGRPCENMQSAELPTMEVVAGKAGTVSATPVGSAPAGGGVVQPAPSAPGVAPSPAVSPTGGVPWLLILLALVASGFVGLGVLRGRGASTPAPTPVPTPGATTADLPETIGDSGIVYADLGTLEEVGKTYERFGQNLGQEKAKWTAQEEAEIKRIADTQFGGDMQLAEYQYLHENPYGIRGHVDRTADTAGAAAKAVDPIAWLRRFLPKPPKVPPPRR